MSAAVQLYDITAKAGRWIAGRRRVPGATTITLTAGEAEYELSVGTIVPSGQTVPPEQQVPAIKTTDRFRGLRNSANITPTFGEIVAAITQLLSFEDLGDEIRDEVLATLRDGVASEADTLKKLAALIAAQAGRLDAVFAGSKPEIDTFLEVFNRFANDESAASALTNAVAGKLDKTGDGSNVSVTVDASTMTLAARFAAVLASIAGLQSSETIAGASARLTLLEPKALPASQRADPRPYAYVVTDAVGRLLLGLTAAGGLDAVLDATAHERWFTSTTRFDESGTLLANAYVAATRAPLALARAYNQPIYVQALPDDPTALRWVYSLDPIICGWWNGQSNTGSVGGKPTSAPRSPLTDIMFFGPNSTQHNQTSGTTLQTATQFMGLQPQREEDYRSGTCCGSVSGYATGFQQAARGDTITGTFNYCSFRGGTRLGGFEPRSGKTADSNGDVLIAYDEGSSTGTNPVVAAPYPVQVGDGVRYMNGSVAMFGIAQNAAAQGEPVTLSPSGIFPLPRVASQAWTLNQTLYWDNTNRLVTNVQGSNLKIGAARDAVAASTATARVIVAGAICYTWDNEVEIKPAMVEQIQRLGRTGVMPMQGFVWGEAHVAGDDVAGVLGRLFDASTAHTQQLFSAAFPNVPRAQKRPQMLMSQVAAGASNTTPFSGTDALYQFYRSEYLARRDGGTPTCQTLISSVAMYQIPFRKGDRVHWDWRGKEIYGGLCAFYQWLALNAPDKHHVAFDIDHWEMDGSDPTTLILYPVNPLSYPTVGNLQGWAGPSPEIDTDYLGKYWPTRTAADTVERCGFGIRNTTNNPKVAGVEMAPATATKPHRILVHFDVAPQGASREWHYAETALPQFTGATVGAMTNAVGQPAGLADLPVEISPCRGQIFMRTGQMSAGYAQLGHLMGPLPIPKEDRLYLLAQHQRF